MTPPPKLTPEQIDEAIRLPNGSLPCGIGTTREHAVNAARAIEAARDQQWVEMLAGQEELKPCRSPYCECEANKCTHPGFYDARHEPTPVAWMHKETGLLRRNDIPKGADWECGDWQPLYTHPATL